MVKPLLIDWAVTFKCNLKCKHCRWETQKEELPLEEKMKLIEEIKLLNPYWVIIEGGEPLLYEEIWELLSHLKKKDIPLYLITNGTTLNEETILKLKKINPYIMVSIDGPIPSLYEEIRRKSDFSSLLTNLKFLKTHHLLYSLNFTLMKANVSYIKEMFTLAKEVGAEKVNIIGLKPCKNYHSQLPGKEEYRESIFSVIKWAKELGIKFFFDEPFFWAVCEEYGLEYEEEGSGGIVFPTRKGCIIGEYIFITPDGEVAPCSFINYSVGNVKEGLKKVWDRMGRDKLLQELKEKEKRKGKCRWCKYFKICKGCRARVYSLQKEWFTSDPLCPVT